MLQSSIPVETFSPPLGNSRVELLLLYCLPLAQRSTTANIAGVSRQDNLPLCSRHAQALSVGHLPMVIEVTASDIAPWFKLI